jgi:hypothetical protein
MSSFFTRLLPGFTAAVAFPIALVLGVVGVRMDRVTRPALTASEVEPEEPAWQKRQRNLAATYLLELEEKQNSLKSVIDSK